MIQELNEKHTRVKVSNIFHTSNIIKYKRGEAFYFFKEMKTMVLYNKRTDEKETVVRFEYQRTKQSSYNYHGNEHWGTTKHDFFNGEKFTDRFEFVNFNDIPEGVEKNYLVDAIKNNCYFYNFKMTNYLTKVCDNSIDHYMETILETRKNNYKAEEQQNKRFKRWQETGILDSLEKAKSCDHIISINKSIGYPITDSFDLKQQKPETIILKKHTHKRNNKVVLNKPLELGIIMSPRGYPRGYGKDLSDSFQAGAYIGGVDPATTTDVNSLLVGKVMNAANVISNSTTTNVANYITTSQYVSDQLNNALGVPKDFVDGNSNILNRYANKPVNPKYYNTIKFECGAGGGDDNMKVLSKNKKKINNKVCISEDKLVIL